MDPQPPQTDTVDADSQLDRVLRGAARAPELSLDPSHLSIARTADAEERPEFPGAPPRLSDYEILEPLGHGGMGVVYRARQKATGRTVALKLLGGPRRPQPEALRRFEREIRVLGRLSHPRIAHLYGAGVTEDGTPFFTMELVEGVTLDASGASGSELPRRLERFRQVCDAVSHAHRLGIIHRDLKPTNVMVCASGQDVKVLDFGLARLEEPERDEAAPITRTGALQGTLAYMSPEQINGAPVTTLSDVYSLGVMLYELITGQRPHEVSGDDLRETLRRVCEDRPRALGTLTLRLPRAKDLDAIVQKALEKDPSRRYQSVAELSGDIENYMTNRPVLPGQIRLRAFRTLYSLGLFCRRNRAAVIVGTVAVAALVWLGAWSVGRIDAERHEANRRLGELYAEEGRREALDGNLIRSGVYLSEALTRGADSRALRLMLRQATRAMETAQSTLPEPAGVRSSDAFSPDGARFVTVGEGGTASVWDLRSGRRLMDLAKAGVVLASAAFSPDGGHVVTASAHGQVQVWDGSGAEVTPDPMKRSGDAGGTQPTGPAPEGLNLLTSPESSVCAKFSRDGKRILLTLGRGVAKVLDAQSGQLLDHLEIENSKGLLVFDEDGSRVVAIETDGAWVYDVKSGQRLVSFESAGARFPLSAAWSPDGLRVITAGLRSGIWDAASGRLMVELQPQSVIGFNRSASFSPNGTRVVVTEGSDGVRIYDSSSGRPLPTFHGLGLNASGAAFSPDGERLFTVGRDFKTRIWPTEPIRPLATLGAESPTGLFPAFSGDGTRLASAAVDGTVRVWNGRSGRLLNTFTDRFEASPVLVLSRDGRLAVSVEKIRRHPQSGPGKHRSCAPVGPEPRQAGSLAVRGRRGRLQRGRLARRDPWPARRVAGLGRREWSLAGFLDVAAAESRGRPCEPGREPTADVPR